MQFATAPPTHAIPPKLSFTQLKAYQTCPWQYHYAHILRIPLRGRWTLSFGQTMHLTLQKFFNSALERSSLQQSGLFAGTNDQIRNSKFQTNTEFQIPKLEELLKIYESAWIDDWYSDILQKQKYFEDGKQMLREFYARHEREGWPAVRATEQPFVVKFGLYSVKGKADRIDNLADGSVEIIDYKTGKPSERLDADNKTQLLIYQVAARQALGIQPRLLSYYYLETNEKMSFLGTEEEIADLGAIIEKVGQNIANGKFAPDPGRHCAYCDFKDICPYARQ